MYLEWGIKHFYSQTEWNALKLGNTSLSIHLVRKKYTFAKFLVTDKQVTMSNSSVLQGNLQKGGSKCQQSFVKSRGGFPLPSSGLVKFQQILTWSLTAWWNSSIWYGTSQAEKFYKAMVCAVEVLLLFAFPQIEYIKLMIIIIIYNITIMVIYIEPNPKLAIGVLQFSTISCIRVTLRICAEFTCLRLKINI